MVINHYIFDDKSQGHIYSEHHLVVYCTAGDNVESAVQ